jgi:hypothetical protein
MHPSLRYTYVAPNKKNWSTYAREVPGRFFKELDEQSAYANPEFDKNGEAFQPKRELYDNSAAFGKLKGSVLNLYNELLASKAASDEKISFLTNNNKYRLPQIQGRDMTLLFRGGLTP